jgi:diacylglycerol kinase (ATP)
MREKQNAERYCIILNPSAGSNHAARVWPRVETALKAMQLAYKIHVTDGPGDAIQLAANAAWEGYEVVVSIGGDGTANEVINGLMRARSGGFNIPALGLIGVGRGSDFAHAVGIPPEIDAAVEVLAGGQRRLIDVGRVLGGIFPEGRYFGNCVGVGFDAVGTIEAAKLPRLGGFLSFFIAVMKTIFLYHQGPLVQLRYDGRSLQERVLMVSVMNGRRLGGGFWMAPESSLDDGQFDICVVRQASRRRVLSLVPHFMHGTQVSQAEVTMVKASQIELQALEGILPAQTDGEILSVEGQKLTIELIPRALAVITAGQRS